MESLMTLACILAVFLLLLSIIKMAINLIPLKATVYFEPHEYVQHCEDNGTKPSLEGFEEYVYNEMKHKGHKQPFIERDWSNLRSSYLVKEDEDV